MQRFDLFNSLQIVLSSALDCLWHWPSQIVFIEVFVALMPFDLCFLVLDLIALFSLF